jgi:hypothetical protein
MDRETLLVNLDSLIQELEAVLKALVGESSLCQIGKEGQPANAVKYNEGKYHAVRTAQRLFSQQSDAVNTIENQLDKATRSLIHYKTGRIQHPDWISYYQGEVDGYQAVKRLMTKD